MNNTKPFTCTHFVTQPSPGTAQRGTGRPQGCPSSPGGPAHQLGVGLKAGPQKAWLLLTELGTLGCFPTAYFMLETTWYWFRDPVTFSQVVIFVHTHCQVLNQKWPRHIAEGAARFPPGGPPCLLPQRDPTVCRRGRQESSQETAEHRLEHEAV